MRKSILTAIIPVATIVSSSALLAKGYNLSTNPVYLMNNELSAGLDYGINKKYTIGVEAGYIFDNPSSGLSGYETDGFEVGVRGVVHQRRYDEDGFYGSAGLAYGSLSISNRQSEVVKVSAYAPRITGGYQWAWNNDFNLKFGAGIRRIIFSESKLFNNSLSMPDTTTVALELQVGYFI